MRSSRGAEAKGVPMRSLRYALASGVRCLGIIAPAKQPGYLTPDTHALRACYTRRSSSTIPLTSPLNRTLPSRARAGSRIRFHVYATFFLVWSGPK